MRLHFGRRAAATLIVVLGIGLGAPGAGAANLDEACGGPSGITCNSALWCRLPDGQCSVANAPGTCAKMPDFCMRVSRPVCGCNGKTYPNECDREKPRRSSTIPGRAKPSPRRPTAPRKSARRASTEARPAGFPDGCCFQVIYFVCNISFGPAAKSGRSPWPETPRLTHAVKNAWAELAPNRRGGRWKRSGEIDVVEDCGGAGGHHRGGSGDVDAG